MKTRAERERERYERRKELGLCVVAGCSSLPAEGAVQCRKHLEQKARNSRRREASEQPPGRPRLQSDDPEVERKRAYNREKARRSYQRKKERLATQTHA